MNLVPAGHSLGIRNYCLRNFHLNRPQRPLPFRTSHPSCTHPPYDLDLLAALEHFLHECLEGTARYLDGKDLNNFTFLFFT